MKKTLIAVSAILTLAAGSGFAKKYLPNSTYSESDLVWKDDFNGDKLDPDSWNYEFHQPGWVNAELQSYDDNPANTYVKDGFLYIQPLKHVNEDGSVSYTSGRINTEHKRAFKYGRMEARIKFPKGKGFLPAFWMIADNQGAYGYWPKCGEIDIAEVLGDQTKSLFGTLHFGDPHSMQQGRYDLKDDDFSENFHVIALEWEPAEMRFYCDGELYATINDWFSRKNGFGALTYPAPYDQPFFFILNVAVGGFWPGYPDDSTPFDERAQMVVDYIKVYQKKHYDENVSKPNKLPVLLEKKSFNGNFVSEKPADWNFLTAGNGQGNLKVDDGVLTITTDNEGTLEYSLQAVQGDMPLEQGKSYKFSFDAWADEPRTMISGIVQPSHDYNRVCGDTKIEIKKEPQHFEYTFNMINESDANGRIDFNLGAQKSKANVYIKNVRLEQTGTLDMLNFSDPALPDGNYIRNGEFQEGEKRLENWIPGNPSKGSISVTNQNFVRELKVDLPKKCADFGEFKITQKNLRLPSDAEMILTFDARATKPTEILVKVAGQEFKAAVNSSADHFEYIFKTGTMPRLSDMEITFGNRQSVVYLDNVCLKEDVLMINGEFNSNMSCWTVFADGDTKTKSSVETVEGNKLFQIAIDKTGSADWKIQLLQHNITLKEGTNYVLKFRAKSDMKRKIMCAMQRDGNADGNWISYSGTPRTNLTSEWQTIEVPFTMNYTTDEKAMLSISLGAVDGTVINKSHTICIDSVELVEVKD